MTIETTPEFFRNIKSIPDKSSREYDAFFANELDKITYGITINGVYIHGWLYFHWNHWHINKDVKDERNGDIIRKLSTPDMRDNEWIIAEHLKMAEEQKKGLMIFGSRRLGKSVSESSWIGRGATIYDGSENVISSTNSQDLSIVTGLIDNGMNNLHPYFKHARIKNDWGKQVVLGVKDKKGEDYVFSKIAIRNLNDGLKTEAFAGLTPKTLIIDEIGKADWGAAFESAKPSFTSPFGWRCVPWLTGTGGTLKSNSDAEKYFTHPENHNFLATHLPGKKKMYGLFISGLKRMEGKEKTTFGNFLKTRSGILIPEESELAQLEFFDTNEEKAKAVIQKELDDAIKDNDPKAYLKQRMYFPEDPDDCFLTDDGNDFPIDALREHLEYLEAISDPVELVELFRKTNGEVDYKSAPAYKKIVTDFPVSKETFKDAPVQIWEHPMELHPPIGLYIAGADPYNQNTSVNSESLGTVYIYKRMYDAIGGTFQDSIVAALASRPGTMKQWHEDVEMLLDYYNAICMPENEGGTFIQHFDQKNKAHMLANGYSLSKQINPKTTVVDRDKGLAATTNNKNFYMNLMLEYTKEEVQAGTAEDGSPIMKLGLVRIPDKVLLREMIGYRKSDGNYDRIVAFGHALACNVYFNKVYPVVKFKEEESKEPQPKQVRSPFILTPHNPFTTGRKGI